MKKMVRTGLGTALVVGLLSMPMAAFAEEDPNLDQRIDSGQAVVTGEPAVLNVGHVDIGPRFVDGVWTLLIHDDAGKADAAIESVWRYPEEAVFHVVDEAKLAVPDDENYAFIGVEPGTEVWVVPQTQHPDVVWAGWNTQDPEVMERIQRGVTLSFTGLNGPGEVTVYLQSGNFGAPTILWQSETLVADGGSQRLWVDTNTHTHANWVFTEPGVYLLEVEVAADLVDGSTASDTRLLRFAVGNETNPDAARTAVWQQPENQPDNNGSATEHAGQENAPDAGQIDGQQLEQWLMTGIIAVALLLVLAFLLILLSGRAIKRKALDRE